MERKDRIAQLKKDIQFKRFSDFKGYEALSNELVTLARKNDDKETLALGLAYKAHSALCLGHYHECFASVDESIKLANEYQLSSILTLSLNTMALFYKNVNDDNLALEYFLRASENADKQNDFEYQAKIQNNIGDMFLLLKEYETALPYFVETYRLCEFIEDEYLRNQVKAIASMNLCEVDIALGNYESAVKYALECEELALEINAFTIYDAVYGYEAIAYYYVGDCDKAVQLIDKLIDQSANSSDDLVNTFNTYMKVMDILLKMKDQKRADIILAYLYKFAEILNADNFHLNKMEMHILYFETFPQAASKEKVDQAYRDFFNYSINYDKSRLKNRSESLLVKLDLYQTLQNQAKISLQNEELRRISNYDELTSIPNRRAFNLELFRLFNALKKDEQIGIIVFDVDFFKQYNDNYGHLAGDEVLKKVASCLISDDNRFYETRYGGDEFMVICHDVVKQEIEAYIAEVNAKLKALKIAHEFSLTNNLVTVSSGYAVSNIEDVDAYQIIKNADNDLYNSKSIARHGIANKRK